MKHKWKPKKKIKKLPLRLSFSTRPLSQSRCTSEDSERLQQQLAEKDLNPFHPRRASYALKASNETVWLHLCQHPVIEKSVSLLKQIIYTKKCIFLKRELSHELKIQIEAYFSKLLQPLNITSAWIRASCLLYAPVVADSLRRVCTCGAAVVNYSNGDLKENIWQSVAAASGLVFRSRCSVFTEMKRCSTRIGASRWLPTSRNTSGSSCGTDSTPVWAEKPAETFSLHCEGNTAVQWLALLPHSKTVEGLILSVFLLRFSQIEN